MIINIKLGDTVYYSGKITTFLSKEVLKIQKDAITLAKKATELQELSNSIEENSNNSKILELTEEVMNKTEEIIDKKLWIICETYERKFNEELLIKTLDDKEIDFEISKIVDATRGIVSKN